MKSKWIIPLFPFLVIIVPIGFASLAKSLESNYADLPVLIQIDGSDSYSSLTDHNGKVFSPDQFREKITVAHCFFSHCVVVCPKIFHELKPVSEISGVNIVSITVDPNNDSTEQLLKFASIFKLPASWRLITGSKQELYRFIRKSLRLVATDGDGGEQDFIHSENVVLIDNDNKVRGFYKGTDREEINKLIADIKKLRR